MNRELKIQQYLVEKMAISLAKMCMQDMNLAKKLPSVLAVGVIYVTLMTLEQTKKKDLLNKCALVKLIEISKVSKDDLDDIYTLIQHMSENFEAVNCVSFTNFKHVKNIHYNIMA